MRNNFTVIPASMSASTGFLRKVNPGARWVRWLLALREEEFFEEIGRPPRRPTRATSTRFSPRKGPTLPDGAKNYVVDGRLSGGFALIAFPAQYGSTGVMTSSSIKTALYISGTSANTRADLALQIVAYNPDNSWELAQR